MAPGGKHDRARSAAESYQRSISLSNCIFRHRSPRRISRNPRPSKTAGRKRHGSCSPRYRQLLPCRIYRQYRKRGHQSFPIVYTLRVIKWHRSYNSPVTNVTGNQSIKVGVVHGWYSNCLKKSSNSKH